MVMALDRSWCLREVGLSSACQFAAIYVVSDSRKMVWGWHINFTWISVCSYTYYWMYTHGFVQTHLCIYVLLLQMFPLSWNQSPTAPHFSSLPLSQCRILSLLTAGKSACHMCWRQGALSAWVYSLNNVSRWLTIKATEFADPLTA